MQEQGQGSGYRDGPLVLASSSPQRRVILEQLGIAFEVHRVDVEERTSGVPHEVACTNALAKAQAGAAARPGATVLGVDTIVICDRAILGKPSCAAAAETMLKRLAGRTHKVVSGLALLRCGHPQVVHEVTKVTFRALDDDLVRRYVQTGEWSGRAGGYAIQGQGAGLVRAIAGDYLNVVGLPAGALLDLDLSLILRRK
ncbi:MAG: Maf family protein [Solirubrobacteraceae bacterium]